MTDPAPAADWRTPNRDELIALCERAIVTEMDWQNRDSPAAQRQLGECWALLRADCDFTVSHQINGVESPDTWWVEITHHAFDCWEWGCSRRPARGNTDDVNCTVDVFYVPTAERLSNCDWY